MVDSFRKSGYQKKCKTDVILKKIHVWQEEMIEANGWEKEKAEIDMFLCDVTWYERMGIIYCLLG